MPACFYQLWWHYWWGPKTSFSHCDGIWKRVIAGALRFWLWCQEWHVDWHFMRYYFEISDLQTRNNQQLVILPVTTTWRNETSFSFYLKSETKVFMIKSSEIKFQNARFSIMSTLYHWPLWLLQLMKILEIDYIMKTYQKHFMRLCML